MNPLLKEMEYAVRGEVPIAAARLDKELRKMREQGRASTYPFDEVLYCNIGNPQSVGQPPISFYRQVLALTDCPSLLAPDRRRDLRALFNGAEIERAEELLAMIPGGSGAYSDSQGVEGVRNNVAAFIETRDGYECNAADVFLTNGASSGIQNLLTGIIAHPRHAIMTPVPQYPIYSALIKLLNGQAQGYFLDEPRGWALHESELERAFGEAVAKGNRPRAMVVINPGNPTGNSLSYDDVSAVIRFCHKHQLVLLADEVYQENVYDKERRPFVSCKRVMNDIGLPIELASFHSTSKGFIGECGRRGGYMELCNFSPDVKAQLVKLASSGLCSNLNGQIMTDLMVRPPPVGPARDQFNRERDAIMCGLRDKAAMVHSALNALPGVSCQPLEGAMYAFPKIELPDAFVRRAHSAGKAPDTAYALSLLASTGICSVPGSGFDQVPGTFHLRLTFLPARDKLEAALERFGEHHLEVLRRHTVN